MHLLSLVRSLADYLGELGLLAVATPTPSDHLLATYRQHLLEVRGLASGTVRSHVRRARELLEFLEFDDRPEALRELVAPTLEGFVTAIAGRLGRAALQGAVSSLRVFLRFLTSRGESTSGLDRSLALPRVYLAERLPCALPRETVQAFLAAIDRTARTGRRDYAMFLMAATYGLRRSEIASLVLDDIRWREATFRIQRPKVRAPIHLPLTAERAYVARIRQLLGEASCVQGTFTPADERLAADWYARGIQFESVRRAWLLGCTRKSFSLLDRPAAEPIRSLRYFVPVLEEVLAGNFPPDYWSHLEFNLGRCEEHWRCNPGTAPGRARPNLEQAKPQPASSGRAERSKTG